MGKRLGERMLRALAVMALGALIGLGAGCGQGDDDTGAGGSASVPRTATTAAADPHGRERALFREHCGTCHTLADAGATGTRAGGEANLDEIKPNTSSVQYYLEHPVGTMPAFRRVLSPAERRALALYVAEVDGCGTASPTDCDR